MRDNSILYKSYKLNKDIFLSALSFPFPTPSCSHWLFRILGMMPELNQFEFIISSSCHLPPLSLMSACFLGAMIAVPCPSLAGGWGQSVSISPPWINQEGMPYEGQGCLLPWCLTSAMCPAQPSEPLVWPWTLVSAWVRTVSCRAYHWPAKGKVFHVF